MISLMIALFLSPALADSFPNSLGERDFFVETVPTSFYTSVAPKPKTLAECRRQIRKVVCLVEPAQKGQSASQRNCLPGGEVYAPVFENLFDHYPRALKRMFCSLNYIFIEKEFVGTAFAGTMKDTSGKTIGAIMGIRKSVIDEKLDLKAWASWKEQLSFGGAKGSYRGRSDLPGIRTKSASGPNDFLYFVIAHEFGHIFDFANDLNKTLNCPDDGEDQECVMAPGSWGSLSWDTSKKARWENEFPLRSGLCFYWCDERKPLQRYDVLQVYSDLADSNFLSTYATSQPWDDFADSLAYFLTNRYLGTSYRIDTKQGPVYDIGAKLHSRKFASKYEYIEKFLKRKDIVYP